MILGRLKRALTESGVETEPDHEDPSLRTRTYGVPYDRVWRASLAIASERRGWTIVRTDDLEGSIEIEAKTPVLRLVDDVEIRIGLDPDGQTRMDVVSESRLGKADLGTNARRVRRFFKHLERRLEGADREPRLGRKSASRG